MQSTLFTTRSLDSYVPKKHPLRRIQELLNRALVRLIPLAGKGRGRPRAARFLPRRRGT